MKQLVFSYILSATLFLVALLMPTLSQANQSFRDVFENHTAVMLLISPETGTIIDANTAASNYYGYSREQLKSMRIQEINQLTPEQVSVERKLAKSQQRNHFIFRHKIASGDVRSVEVFSVPVIIDGKSLLFSIIHDISLGRIQEQDVLHYQEQLEAQIDKRTAELQSHNRSEIIWMSAAIGVLLILIGLLIYAVISIRGEKRAAILAMQHADEESRAKSQFLSSMSHELRTPLNAVLGFSQLLKYDTRRPLDNTQLDHVDHIMKGGEHLLDLVNDILDLAQIEASRLTIEPSKVGLKDICAECVTLTAPLADKSSVTVSVNIGDTEEVYLFTDRRRLLQILFNLISNGIKFNKSGGSVEITGTDLGSGFFRVLVTDTGIGIKKADERNVFQAFRRLDDDPTIAHEGAGIGLAVTKMLIEKLAGQINFDSTYGEGTTFRIDLPLAENKHIIIWDEKMRIGVDALDKDHEIIAGMINKLAAHPPGQDLPIEFVDEMVSYTKYHFVREEAVMAACNYPHKSEHHSFHVDLGRRLDQMEKDIRQNRSISLDHYKDFLYRWWTDHILVEDMKLGKCASGHESKIKKALERIG